MATAKRTSASEIPLEEFLAAWNNIELDNAAVAEELNTTWTVARLKLKFGAAAKAGVRVVRTGGTTPQAKHRRMTRAELSARPAAPAKSTAKAPAKAKPAAKAPAKTKPTAKAGPRPPAKAPAKHKATAKPTAKVKAPAKAKPAAKAKAAKAKGPSTLRVKIGDHEETITGASIAECTQGILNMMASRKIAKIHLQDADGEMLDANDLTSGQFVEIVPRQFAG